MAKTLDPFLTIGETARRCGISSSALRFYEARGLIRSVRTNGNQRRYSRATLRRVAIIQTAQALGLTLREISDALSNLPAERSPTKQDWSRLSKKWYGQLDQRIRELTDLRDKLTSCIGCGCLSLRRCALYNANDRIARRGPGPRYLRGDSPEQI